MVEQTSDSTYRINGLYVTPNWGNPPQSDRVAMSCGIGATIKVLRKVSISGAVVVIAADTAGTIARSWNMTAKNTILRTTAKVYLYARVERNGASGMYIWSANIYNIDGTTSNAGVTAVNNDQYYYIRVGALEANRTEYEIDEGQYGIEWGDGDKEEVGYSWSDLIAWDRGRDLLVFLKTIAGLAIEKIILASQELNRVLTSQDDENADYASSDNAVVTGGFLNRWVNKIKGMFIRKDIADGTDHPLHAGEIIAKRSSVEGSNGIVRTEQFKATSGAMDGYGAGMWMLEDGTGIMETDLFYVRRAAYFRSLTIAEVKHMGGEVILSAAACQIAYVVPYDIYGNPIPATVLDASASVEVAFYRCYFEKQANGRKVYNEWMKNDQARCQRFDANGNEVEGSFYWRLVVNVDEDEDFYYVDLSFADCAPRSNPPKSNDNIVLFGHRNPTAATYDRTCAQVYSTVGIHAPSRAYYSGITSYDLTKAKRPEYLERDAQGNVEWYVGGLDDNSGKEHYIKYNTRTGLDIRTNSMTVIADGKDVSVGEALGDNFQFITSSDKAPTENGEVAKWIPADDIDPSDGWSLEEKDAHVGDYLITSDGFAYEFVRDDSGSVVSHGWQISSDEYLIAAQKDAKAALDNIDKMADDNIVTPSEKSELRRERDSAQSQFSNISNEANVANVDSSKSTNLTLWYKVYIVFLDYILAYPNEDTLLYNEQTGKWLTATIEQGSSLVKINDDREADEQPTTPIGKNVKFTDCYKLFCFYLASLRYEITREFKSRIDRIQVNGNDINESILNKIIALEGKVGGVEGSNQKLEREYASITNNTFYKDLISGKTWNALKGLLTADGYASMFATAFNDKNEVIASALANVYVSYDPATGNITSGVNLSADKIDFSAESITMFSQNFRISSKELSIYYDESSKKEIIVIDTDNLKLNADGAEFSGTIRANGGMIMGYSELNITSHGTPSANVISAADSLAMIRFDSSHNTVFLPPNPREGQIIRVYAIGDARLAPTLKVRSSQYKIFKAAKDVSEEATIDHGHTGDFVFDDRGERGAGVWYYIAES